MSENNVVVEVLGMEFRAKNNKEMMEILLAHEIIGKELIADSKVKSYNDSIEFLQKYKDLSIAEIYSTFIKTDSVKELNISGPLLKEFNQAMSQNQVEQLDESKFNKLKAKIAESEPATRPRR